VHRGSGTPPKIRQSTSRTTGERVESAQAKVEDAGANVTLEPEPGHAEGCTVTDQNVTGEADPEQDVTLNVKCTPPE